MFTKDEKRALIFSIKDKMSEDEYSVECFKDDKLNPHTYIKKRINALKSALEKIKNSPVAE